jgi:ribonuclease Z
VKHIFVSHADRDHLMGLLQFNQLNARPEFPIIHYPADSGSFPHIADFVKKFDPHVSGTVWKPIREGQAYYFKGNHFVEPIKNGHIDQAEGVTKSLSFKVNKTKRKLKAKFKNLAGNEIANLIAEHGQDYATEHVVTNILGYSGDTPVENYDRWDGTKVLIHEATFLRDETLEIRKKNKHSQLEEVIKMVSEINVEQLILSHFSTRYSGEEIDEYIVRLCKKYQLKIPVFRVLPGEVGRDILRNQPIYLAD